MITLVNYKSGVILKTNLLGKLLKNKYILLNFLNKQNFKYENVNDPNLSL